MTSGETGAEHVARRSRITPERLRELYDVVLDQLREDGYEALTMEGVAAGARCSKSTLYRQWGTKPRFVAAALRAGRSMRFAGIDTGSLAGDLREAARVAGERAGSDTRLLGALGHAMFQDEELRRALREALIEPEVAAIDAMVRRAVARGEIARDHPAVEFLAAQFFGVVRLRPALAERHADAAYLVRFVEAAVLPALGLLDPQAVAPG